MSEGRVGWRQKRSNSRDDDHPQSGAVTAAGTRRPRARDSGISVNSPTIAMTTTMTPTFGSSKLWLATTSAAAMFRCAVPRPRTDRVSLAGPPSAQPQAKPTARNRTPARMPPVPKIAITLRTFNNVWSVIRAIRLMFDVLSKIGLIVAARSGRFALSANAPANGSSISSTRDLAISAGFTDTPGSSSGNTRGRYPTVITMSSTIRPTANARFPLEICASFGRKGAPLAIPNSNRPIAIGSSSRKILASAMAAKGITTKFAASARMTCRQLRSGATISLTRSPRPMPIMLDRTNAIMQVEMAACFRSMRFSPVRHAASEADGPRYLNRISLVSGAVAELLEKPDARIEPMFGKYQVRHEPERIDSVPLPRLVRGHCRSRLRGRLSLLVPGDADLQACLA